MSRSPDFFAELLASMTLEEKAGQLSLYSAEISMTGADPANPEFNLSTSEQRLADIRAGRVTGVFNGRGADFLRPLQQAAVEGSRLGIPLIFGADVIHGYRTAFPTPLGEAASFEPELARRTAEAAAAEAAADGLHWTFAPGADVCRDARWGRVVETSGEDPLLAARFAAARVEGFQGADLTDPSRMMATVKHFAAYGAAEGGLDYATADVSRATLHEVHLPGFRAAVAAGCGSVMSAFNDVDGLPCSANPYLLTEVLKQDWAFDGFVVSDFTSELEIVAHGVAAGPREAARACFLAGLDMSMQSGIYAEHLPDLVRSGEVAEALLDAAVMRVLRAKHRLGLFDDPYRGLDTPPSPAVATARDLARESARRTLTLLKNDGGVLPLKPGAKVALIGPLARENQHLNGPWAIFSDNARSVSLYNGLVAALGEAAVETAPGCDLTRPGEDGFAEALAIAARADVVLLALGEGQHMSGESRSRLDITVPEPQMALARVVRTLGKPTAVLLRTGRPLAIAPLLDLADAVLVTWFGGSETGSAVADVLTGVHAPSGRLPISFPRHPAQVPIYYGHKSTGRPADRVRPRRFTAHFFDVAPGPLFPFGFGLGYGAAAYGPTEIDRETLAAGETLTVVCKVTETAGQPITETPQLYVRDLVASVTRPVRELKAFAKLEIAAGGEAVARFTLTADDLAWPHADGRMIAEPGAFEVCIAPHAETGEWTRFELLSEVRDRAAVGDSVRAG